MKDKEKTNSNDTDLTMDTGELDDSVVAEESLTDTVKILREKLKTAEKERQEYLTGWQRAKADLINARKQDEKEKQDFVRFANEQLVVEILPVITNFELAMANKEVWEKVDKNWRVGVEHIYSQLLKVLKGYGMEEINPLNQKYDPARDETAGHEAVTDKSKEGVIVSVIQKGYLLNGKTLRAPKVMVGEYKESK